MKEKSNVRTRDILGVEKTQCNLAALFETIPLGADRRQIFLREVVVKFSRSALGERASELTEVFSGLPVNSFENDEKFFAAVVETVLNFLDDNFNPLEMEKWTRARFFAKGNFVPLSEILSFGHDERVAHIHLAPARTMGPKEMLTSVISGLRELARRLNEDESLRDIERVTATSALVAEHSSLMERLGFSYTGLIDDETRQKYFSDETRPVGSCHMSREDFLKRYLVE